MLEAVRSVTGLKKKFFPKYWLSFWSSEGINNKFFGKTSFFSLLKIPTNQGRYQDGEGGCPRAKLINSAPDVLTPTISPNVGNWAASFVVAGDCIRNLPWNKKRKKIPRKSYLSSWESNNVVEFQVFLLLFHRGLVLFLWTSDSP